MLHDLNLHSGLTPEWALILLYGFAAIIFVYTMIVVIVKRELRKEMRYLAMTKPKPPREKNGRFKKLAF